MNQRQIVLDTETTGLDPEQGHRIIEIGCVELVNRKHTKQHYHQYINPEREVDAGALEVHGISNEFLSDKPVFSKVVSDFIEFVEGAELIIHNAPFDIGFINHELKLCNYGIESIADICTVTDSLQMARKKHPGQKNNLDTLCKRYTVDNSGRELHGALLDSEILADVYLLMTGGQTSLTLNASGQEASDDDLSVAPLRVSSERTSRLVITPSEKEIAEHKKLLDKINRKSDNGCIWLTANISN